MSTITALIVTKKWDIVFWVFYESTNTKSSLPIHSNLWLSSWTKATLSFDKFSGTFDVVFSGFVFNYVRISICKDDFKCNNFSYKCAGRNNTKICSRVKRWTFALITITWATLTFSEIEGCCAKYFCEGALPRPFFNFQRLQSSFYSR